MFVGCYFREIRNNHDYHQVDSRCPDADSSAGLESVDEVKRCRSHNFIISFYFPFQGFYGVFLQDALQEKENFEPKNPIR